MSECNALAAYTALSHYSYTSITGSFESNSKISIGYFIIVKIKLQEFFCNKMGYFGAYPAFIRFFVKKSRIRVIRRASQVSSFSGTAAGRQECSGLRSRKTDRKGGPFILFLL